jgi:hypothetical protein
MPDRIPDGAVRELLTVVLDAITLPYGTPDYDRRILDRAAHARTVATAALAEDPADIGWNADYLRARIAEEATTEQRKREREENRCQRCRIPFDPTARRHDGQGRHVCVICVPSQDGDVSRG